MTHQEMEIKLKELEKRVKVLEQENFVEEAILMNSIWVVTYCDDDDHDPTVTCFSNYEAAEKCYNYFKNIHKFCCLDECELYNSFYCSN